MIRMMIKKLFESHVQKKYAGEGSAFVLFKVKNENMKIAAVAGGMRVVMGCLAYTIDLISKGANVPREQVLSDLSVALKEDGDLN